MRSSFHYRQMGVVAPQPRLAAIKKALFFRVLRNPWLRRLLTIDEPLAKYPADSPVAAGKVELMPEPADLGSLPDGEEAKRRIGVPVGRKLILVYGSITRRKGVVELLRALADPGFPPLSTCCSPGRCPGRSGQRSTRSGFTGWWAWERYDDGMSEFLSLGIFSRLLYLRRKLGAGWPAATHYFLALHMTAQGKLSSWAYRWNLSIWSNGGAALSPGMNLSRNTGIGSGASHTGNELNLLSYGIAAPSAVISSEVAEVDPRVDRIVFRNIGKTHSIFRMIRMLVSVCVPNGVFFAARRFFRAQ